MKLITKEIERQLLANGADRGADHVPVVKLFTPSAGATWLLTELDPEDPDIAFGLCDLGQGVPELGSVSLSEIANSGITVERDLWFTASKTLSEYTNLARAHSYIKA